MSQDVTTRSKVAPAAFSASSWLCALCAEGFQHLIVEQEFQTIDVRSEFVCEAFVDLPAVEDFVPLGERFPEAAALGVSRATVYRVLADQTD